jgi:hypothetical protein
MFLSTGAPSAVSACDLPLVKPVKATASSTYGNTKPESLFDGKVGTKKTWTPKECFHTKQNNKPWVKFDLGKQMKVCKVVIYNRLDGSSDRLFPFQVTVGDNYNNMGGAKACVVPSGKPYPVNVECKQNVGRYVMVRLLKNTFLNLCEVKIYAEPSKFHCRIVDLSD